LENQSSPAGDSKQLDTLESERFNKGGSPLSDSVSNFSLPGQVGENGDATPKEKEDVVLETASVGV